MINLLKLTTLITIYVIIISLFSFAYNPDDSIGNSISDTETIQNAAYNEMVSTALDNIMMVDTSSVDIDNRYTEMVLEQFILDAEKNGLNRKEVLKHIKSLDAILVSDLNQYGLLGITIYRPEYSSPTGMRGIIFINQDLLANKDLYMLTLYHELGHWFGLPHSDCMDDIMMSGYDVDYVFNVMGEWDMEVKELMEDIEGGWNEDYLCYSFPSFY